MSGLVYTHETRGQVSCPTGLVPVEWVKCAAPWIHPGFKSRSYAIHAPLTPFDITHGTCYVYCHPESRVAPQNCHPERSVAESKDLW